MSRKPAHLTAGAHLNAREAIWTEIRRRKVFTVADLAARTSIPSGTIRTYVLGLERAGYVAREGQDESPKQRITYVKNQLLALRYRLVRDTGVEAPRVRKNGELVTQGLARESLWRTMRILREFTWAELAHAASTEEIQVDRDDTRKYCYALKQAGYLVLIVAGAPGRSERYRFVPSRYSGPRAPMLQRVRQVYDPNLKRVVWPKEAV